MASMSLIAASVVSSFMLGTSAEVIPLDEVQHVLDSGVVAQSRSVVVGEDGTRWILEEVGADVRTERVIQRSGVEMPLPLQTPGTSWVRWMAILALGWSWALVPPCRCKALR